MANFLEASFVEVLKSAKLSDYFYAFLTEYQRKGLVQFSWFLGENLNMKLPNLFWSLSAFISYCKNKQVGVARYRIHALLSFTRKQTRLVDHNSCKEFEPLSAPFIPASTKCSRC